MDRIDLPNLVLQEILMSGFLPIVSLQRFPLCLQGLPPTIEGVIGLELFCETTKGIQQLEMPAGTLQENTFLLSMNVHQMLAQAPERNRPRHGSTHIGPASSLPGQVPSQEEILFLQADPL